MTSCVRTGRILRKSQIIEKNTRVRLKIVGTRVDATEIVSALLSFQVHYLMLVTSLLLGRSRKITWVLSTKKILAISLPYP